MLNWDPSSCNWRPDSGGEREGPLVGPSPEKKAPPHHKRSGLQSFDKGAIIAGDSGLYASGAGPSCPVIVGWSTRNRPRLPRPINDIP